MAGVLRPITALLIAAAILLMGNGLLGVLLPLRADAEAFTHLQIGAMGSSYYAGLMTGCLIAPLIIARVGHIRAFVAFTASATITPLLHAMAVEPLVWCALRALNGLCFAGLFMGIESWLSGSATSETRGRVLAAYTIVNLTVVTVGMQMSGTGDPRGFQLFSLVAILYSLAAVPVALAPSAAPSPPRTARLRLAWLISVSPAAVAGCFFTGLANSAFWTLAPLYGKGAWLSAPEIATFLTVAVLGGAVSQWPVGYYSDRYGRRGVAVVVAMAASAAGVGLYTVSRGSLNQLYLFALIYGTMAFPIYTLCVAHANDLVHKKRAIEVSSGLLLTFSIGAVIGPLIASVWMSHLGHGALFLHSAVAHALIAGVMLVRAQLRPVPPVARNEDFVAVPKTTPAVFELDPRGEASGRGEQRSLARV